MYGFVYTGCFFSFVVLVFIKKVYNINCKKEKLVFWEYMRLYVQNTTFISKYRSQILNTDDIYIKYYNNKLHILYHQMHRYQKRSYRKISLLNLVTMVFFCTVKYVLTLHQYHTSGSMRDLLSTTLQMYNGYMPYQL